MRTPSANDKGPGALGCLAMLGLFGYIAWQFVGCDGDRERYREPARRPYSAVDTPRMRNMAADVVRASGYWCDPPTQLREGMWNQTPNRRSFVLVCDDGGSQFASYEIEMNPNTGRGTVRER